MTDRNEGATLFGVLLVLVGGLWLLDAANVVELTTGWVALLFAVPGLIFAWAFVRNRDRWWAAIPAGALLGLAGLIGSAEASWLPTESTSASLLLGGIGLGFVAVAVRTPERWWAVIPAGVLLTLAVFIGIAPTFDPMLAVAVLMFGLALTFVLVAAFPLETGRMRWPLVPAVVLGALGTIFAFGATDMLQAMQWIWPVAVIAVGLALLLRTGGGGGQPTVRN
jgi:hypothetical protein